jgi:hypothetical protein
MDSKTCRQVTWRFKPASKLANFRLAHGSPGQFFLTSDTLASMSISYDHVDWFANEPFSWPQAMAKRELL